MGVKVTIKIFLTCDSNPSCSYYFGIRANIVLTDVEMLKQVLMKEFDSFMNRQVCWLF